MTKVAQVRKEFGEPFRDVVNGFALMGYSKAATAEILEISRDYFTKHLLPVYAPDAPWKPQKDMRPECKPRGKGWPKGKPRNKPQKYTDEELLALVAKYPSFTEFRDKAEPNMGTIYNRFGSWRRSKKLAEEIKNAHH